ncbi:MAG: glutathione S-transferase [Phenylobacterium sp.]|nr:glutathione S-transferase [Phenylobacterium sp.]
MITIYHLDRSRSERPVWLMEELGAPYAIEFFDRLESLQAEPAYKALHPVGSSPVIAIDGKVLGESGAVVEYLATTQGGGRLAVAPGAADYPDYLYWFHFAEATLMYWLTSEIMAERAQTPFDNPIRDYSRQKAGRLLAHMDARLGQAPYFAGEAFTAADIMMTFPLTTTRLFTPFDLTPYANINGYLTRIAARPAYQRAQRIAGPDRDRTRP